MGRVVGLHIRLPDTIDQVAQKIEQLHLSAVQFFLIRERDGKLAQPTDQQIETFKQRCSAAGVEHFYLHASYYSNLCDCTRTRSLFLHHEIQLAKKFGITHVVLHAGTARRCRSRRAGIDKLTWWLNRLIAQEPTCTFILENVAYGGMVVGGDLDDFVAVLEHLEQPDRLRFCIDTAHAYSFGYDIVTGEGREQFVNLLAQTIGIERIALIHLNDTYEQRGSCLDRHALVGSGTIGEEALKQFAQHSFLKDKPLILEPPLLAQQEQLNALHTVSSW